MEELTEAHEEELTPDKLAEMVSIQHTEQEEDILFGEHKNLSKRLVPTQAIKHVLKWQEVEGAWVAQ